MKRVLYICFAVVLAALVWQSQMPTFQRLAERADSAEGLDAKDARSFIRETLTDSCYHDATRRKITQLSADDCVLAVENKDMLCSTMIQMTGERIIRSEQLLRTYAEKYLACLYPDDTNYVDADMMAIFRP